MTRIPPLPYDQMDEVAQKAFDTLEAYGSFANWSRIAGRRAPILHHVAEMLTELRDDDVLPRRALELAMVTVSKLNACTYCVSHHAPHLQVTGMSPEGVDRLPEVENHPELDDCDKAVVRYSEAVNNRAGRMRDAEVSDLRQWFDEAQIVELTWRIALCGAFNRFNDALQLNVEDEVDEVQA
jgi:uncharacterized peroxidase-related enzyme